MKKLTLLLAALMITGVSFAGDGKNDKACCKKDEKKECCKKDSKKCDKDKETAKKDDKAKDDKTTTAKK